MNLEEKRHFISFLEDLEDESLNDDLLEIIKNQTWKSLCGEFGHTKTQTKKVYQHFTDMFGHPQYKGYRECRYCIEMIKDNYEDLKFHCTYQCKALGFCYCKKCGEKFDCQQDRDHHQWFCKN